MADLSAYIASIREATKGEVVRDSIIKALHTLNTEGMKNAATLNWHPPEYFATYAQVYNKQTKLAFDKEPTYKPENDPTNEHTVYEDPDSGNKSGYVVYSGGLYNWIGGYDPSKQDSFDKITKKPKKQKKKVTANNEQATYIWE